MADEKKIEVPSDLVDAGSVYLHNQGSSNEPKDLNVVDEPYVEKQIAPITGVLTGAATKVIGQPLINAAVKHAADKGIINPSNPPGIAKYAQSQFGPGALIGKDQAAVQRLNQRNLGNLTKTAGQVRGAGVRLGGSQLAQAVPEKTIAQKVMSHVPEASKGVVKGTGTVLGRGLVGAGAGFDAVDAWNRAQAGDIPGAIVSGVGAIGGLASLVPHPIVKGVGTAVSMGAPALNMYLDQLKKEKERGFAKGGSVVEELPKALKAARALIKPTAEEVAAFAPKATKEVKLSEALQNDINKYLGLHQSDPMGTHGGRMGGTGFSEFQHTKPEHALNEVVWANASEEAANRLARQNKINDKDVIWTNYVGAPDQHRTNRTVTNNILDEFYKKKLTPEQYDIINKRIATTLDSKKRPYFPQAFDIRDKFAAQELGADTFHRRGELADILGRGKGTSREGYKGLENFDEILESHRDPRLVGAPTSAVGTRIQEIYPEATQFAPQFHPDYHYPVFGKDRGVSFNAVPQEIAIPDFVNAYRKANVSKSGKPLDPHGNAMFGYMKTPQLISEDYIKWLQSNGMAAGGSVAKKALDAAKEAYKAKFTSGFYHGSPSNKIKDFDPTKTPGDVDMITPGATFVTRDKDFAESFLPMGPKGQYKTGATMYPVSVNLGKHFNPHEELGRKLIQEYAGNTPLGQQMAKGSWEVLESPEFMKHLKDKGYDSMTVFEGGVPNVAVFDPKNIRGKFAKFDPKDAESPDFMKAEGGAVQHFDEGGKASSKWYGDAKLPNTKHTPLIQQFKDKATAAGNAILEGHAKNQELQAKAFSNPERPFQVTDRASMSELSDRMLSGPLGFAPAGMTAFEKLGLTDAAVDAWRAANKVGQRQTRNPILQQAAKDVAEGTITPEQYRSLVREHLPIKPFTEVPPRPSQADIASALKSDQVETGIVGVNKNIEPGTRVSSRLDIPAYNAYDKWIVSLHDPSNAGKSMGYGQTAHLAGPVEFTAPVKAGHAIATGKTDKTTYARIHGNWLDTHPEEVEKRAKELMNDPEWVQVGNNPFRHSYFYDKTDMSPVIGAEEVIQVGPLVLAKKPIKAHPDDPRFRLNPKDENSPTFAEGGPVEDQFDFRNPEHRAKALEKMRIDQALMNEARRTEPLMRPGTAAGYGQQLMDTGNAMRAFPDQLRVNMPSIQQPLSTTDMRNMMAANGYKTAPITAFGGGNAKEQFGTVNANKELGDALVHATLSAQKTPMGAALTNAGVGASIPVGKGHLSGFYEVNPEDKKDYRTGVRYTRKF